MNIGDKVFHNDSGRKFIGQIVHKRDAGKILLVKWENGATREHSNWTIQKCPESWNK